MVHHKSLINTLIFELLNRRTVVCSYYSTLMKTCAATYIVHIIIIHLVTLVTVTYKKVYQGISLILIISKWVWSVICSVIPLTHIPAMSCYPILSRSTVTWPTLSRDLWREMILDKISRSFGSSARRYYFSLCWTWILCSCLWLESLCRTVSKYYGASL